MDLDKWKIFDTAITLDRFLGFAHGKQVIVNKVKFFRETAWSTDSGKRLFPENITHYQPLPQDPILYTEKDNSKEGTAWNIWSED